MTNSDAWFDEYFARTSVMVILRGLGPEESLLRAEVAWDAGVTALELPIQTERDLESLGVVAKAAAERNLIVGAGTVVNVDQVLSARSAGAAFTVSPGFDETVVAASLEAGLPTLAGVASATDIQAVQSAFGLRWLKAFPARQLGPGWIQTMHGPFPAVCFVATGGLDLANAESYLADGARIVSFGSRFATGPALTALAARPSGE
jgi:2-dehydro-3-deoxyphosphogluconate aldolase/(4S)-4-hydroxy-2-oxoglutarate aldolase